MSARPAESVPSALDVFALEALGNLAGAPGVLRAGLALTDGGGRELLFTASDRDADPAGLEWCRIDGSADVPLNVAALAGEVVLGRLDDLEDRFPDFVRGRRDTPIEAVAAVPLVDDGAVLGGFVLFLDATAHPDDLDREGLVELGHGIGAALAEIREVHRRPPSVAPHHAAGARPGAGERHAVHEMPGEPSAVGAARRFLRSTLEAWGIADDLVDDAVLCLAEVATNAVIHTHGGCRIEVRLADGVLAVHVVDRGGLAPRRIAPTVEEMTAFGRGLHIVEAVAARSGRSPEECLSWFEIDLP